MFGAQHFGSSHLHARHFRADAPVRHGGWSPSAARQADRDREEFEDRQQANERSIRDAVEKAFQRVYEDKPAAVPATMTRAQRRDVAIEVREGLRLDGILASLSQIARILAAYEAQIRLEQQRQEDDAVAVLLLTI